MTSPRTVAELLVNSRKESLKADETRAPIFQMVFSQDGDPVATVSCSAAKMQTDQSMAFECPGLSAVMPKDYDAVVVQELRRDTSSS